MGDAKLNIGSLRLARSVSPYRHGFGTIPSHIFLNALYICFCVRCTGNHAALVRLYYYSEHLAALSCENLSGVCADCTDYWALHCLRAAQVSGKPHVQMGYRSIFRLVFQREYVVRLPTCAQGLAGPTPEGKEKSTGFFLGDRQLGFACFFCVPVWASPTNNYTHKYKKAQRRARTNNTHTETEARAQKKQVHKINTEKSDEQCKNTTTNTKLNETHKNTTTNTNENSLPKRTKSKYTQKYITRGDVRVKYTKVVFLLAGLFCANTTRSESRDKTMFRRPNWCRMLALDSFFVACQRNG